MPVARNHPNDHRSTTAPPSTCATQITSLVTPRAASVAACRRSHQTTCVALDRTHSTSTLRALPAPPRGPGPPAPQPAARPWPPPSPPAAGARGRRRAYPPPPADARERARAPAPPPILD